MPFARNASGISLHHRSDVTGGKAEMPPSLFEIHRLTVVEIFKLDPFLQIS
jgi:hypothetical protein